MSPLAKLTELTALTDDERAGRASVCWQRRRAELVSAIEAAVARGLAPRRWARWTIASDKENWPSAAEVAARLFACRADWVPRYLPRAQLGGGKHKDTYFLGNADGDAGRSMPIPLYRQPRVVDFAGGFAGDDLALLARAIGGDSKAAYHEALAYFGIDPKAKAKGPDEAALPPVEPERVLPRNMELAQELWRQTETIPAAGLARAYLTERRGLTAWDDDRLRWHPACPWGRERIGCIVCPVVSLVTPNIDGATGYTVAIWRIRPVMAGKVERLGLGPCKGGFAPLFWPDGDEMAIAEGVEDALAFHERAGVPCWAALSAGNMGELVIPTRLRRVTIVADRDPNGVGLAGAGRLARRLVAEGREVEIVQARHGKDANDVLLARRAVS